MGVPSSSGSDLNLFPLSQLPDPDPPEETDQEVDPAREADFSAPAEFEVFWSGITSNRTKGSKLRAAKSWAKGGKPSAELLIRKWQAYRASIGDAFALHVVTWLNIPGWLEDWEPAPAPRTNGAGSAHLAAASKNYSDGMGQWPGGKVNAT